MNLCFGKKDFVRMYNISSSIFRIWIEEHKLEVGIKETKQTFTPIQIFKMISLFGFPSNCSEKEEELLRKIYIAQKNSNLNAI